MKSRIALTVLLLTVLLVSLGTPLAVAQRPEDAEEAAAAALEAAGPPAPAITAPRPAASVGEYPVYFWDFEGDNGGFVGTLDWEWGTYAWSGGTCDSTNYPPPAAYSGTDMWGTVLNTCYLNRGNNSGFDTCVNGNPADDSILSMTVDLAGIGGTITLSWWEWFDLFLEWDWAEVYANGDVVFQHCGGSLIPPTAWEQQVADLTPYAGGPVTIEFHMMASTVINHAGWYLDDIMISTDSPPFISWDKTVDGLLWEPDMAITRQTGDTIVVEEVLHLTPPSGANTVPATDREHNLLDSGTAQGPVFAQIEAWDPDHLHLLDWDATGGDVIVEPEGITWTGEITTPTTITLTKWFHVEPCTWTQTLLAEELWVDDVLIEERPVLINKLAPDLWIEGAYDPLVCPGGPAQLVLTYGNEGGYENAVTVRNEFPPEAPFAFADPPPDDWDPAGTWAEWWVGDLATGDQGAITVTVAISEAAVPGQDITISDWILDHVGDPADMTEIVFDVAQPVIGADFSWDPDPGIVGEPVTFGATAAGTPPLGYLWDWGDGWTGSGITTTHTYTVEDNYTVTLTVGNMCGSVEVEHLVTVETGTMQIYLPVLLKNS